MKTTQTLLFTGLLVVASSALAFGDDWYLGLSGGAAKLEPNPSNNAIELVDEDELGTAGGVVIGRDLDFTTSVELQLRTLGSLEFQNGAAIDYNSIEGAVLYRFFDTRGNGARQGRFGVSGFGRFGLGLMQRDSSVSLEGDSDIYFGAGAGLEFHFGRVLSLRAEGFYHDTDASSATLALLARFGGRRGRMVTAGQPGDIAAPAATDEPLDSTPPTLPETTTDGPADTNALPETAPTGDGDRDGIDDSVDRCLDSTPGFPVRRDGCALFNGVMSGIVFNNDGSELSAASEAQLSGLADLLKQYPSSRITILAHTDNRGSEADQARLTRERLRSIGLWLVGQGIDARRLNLRAFGGKRPLHDNASAEGRRLNNRIEVLEFVQ